VDPSFRSKVKDGRWKGLIHGLWTREVSKEKIFGVK